ncbi:MAG: hypothetical protein NC548_64580, partial [Lachnospiraceae bacterium]|nr:hypothetical protein [Lachnospiraceae bacterium]
MRLKKLEKFLEFVQTPNKSFGIKGLDLNTCKAYEYETYDCEIALLHKCESENKPNDTRLKEIFKEAFSQKFFELHHPIHNHIKTRAVLSLNNTLVTNGLEYNKFIFFADSANQYPWILIQENALARILITQEGLFISKALKNGDQDFSKWILWLALAELPKIAKNLKVEDISFANREFAISLANPRPYHFFLEDLYWFYKLDLKMCKVANTPAFYKPKLTNLTQAKLTMRPSLLVSNKTIDFLGDEISHIIANKELL